MAPPGSMGPPAGYMGQQGQGQGQLHSGGHNQNALHGSTQEYFFGIIFIQWYLNSQFLKYTKKKKSYFSKNSSYII